MKTKKIYITNMHCEACKKILTDEFSSISGIKKVEINLKDDSAGIGYEGEELNVSEIRKRAEKLGYGILEQKPVPGKNQVFSSDNILSWLKAVALVVLFLITFRIFQNLGFVDSLNTRSSDFPLGVAFLVGLVASVSSCLAVVGSVIIAFGEKYQGEGDGTYAKAIRPNLYFQTGRLVTFFLLGGILGIIGGELSISGSFVSIFSLLIAGVMFWLGLNILGLAPSLSKLGMKMPGKFGGRYWDKLKNSNHRAAPFILGGLSFFLPCGFTQSMQIFALGSGSFWAGGLSLLFFALGTFPSLFLLGAGASWIRERKWVTFERVAGIVVLIFAIYTFNSALALWGSRADVISNKNQEQTDSGNSRPADKGGASQEEQVVTMKVTSSGFEPSTLKIKSGVPVRWVIQGDYVTGCTNKIIVPSLDISQKINSGENVVRFMPLQPGKVPFSCWMGMVRGQFIIE